MRTGAGGREPGTAMPLRKSPTITPQRLAANRANAQHSTGPTSFEGKSRSRFNALRTGRRSKTYQRLAEALSFSDPPRLHETAAAVLTREELEHPFYKREIEEWQRMWEFCARHSPQYKMLNKMLRRRGRKNLRTKPERPLKSRPPKNEAIRLLKTHDLYAKAH
jgi:hypothetical protein